MAVKKDINNEDKNNIHQKPLMEELYKDELEAKKRR